MKKFLSLVLAMIMTMSLVTISAGATEYKDLTDKDEIQYEEAVAVLNRIGVITGYEDGSFRPETELTRGAAAKIIVSLMIGPDAASALPNDKSPYPDVPAGHTFAGVISYCKTAGYISGYGDGTFKPAGTLTGYAFAKMLLGALGYDSDIERFTGTGWTMNVAKIGNTAGLFDRISFDGAAAVNRDQACQLALNTLKATLVTYGGTSIINGSTGSYTIQGTDAKPITSNNRDINANIGRKDWYGGNNQNSDYLTLEFGEEHFKDLRLEHDRFDPAHDDFGRPSNEWSYKKVTIGTFALPADYTYTTQVAHVEDNDGTKEKALGLRNYDLVADGGYSYWNGTIPTWWNSNQTPPSVSNNGFTDLWMNGLEYPTYFSARTADNSKLLRGVADIADFTDNGTLVEVYVSSVDADWITDVVVVQTQLMEVNKVASDYVSLDQVTPDVIDDDGNPDGKPYVGFNQAGLDVKVEQVKDTNEEPYAVLSGLKEGDEVAVIPVTTDGGKTYEAFKVYVPETVSGTLTRVDTYGTGRSEDDKRSAVEITVGGTSYKLADWNKDMRDLTVEKIKATRKDVTLLMDEYGNALLAKDVGSTDDFMIIGSYYQALSGNKICTYVHGWDISGTEVDLNLGSSIKVNQHGNNGATVGDHVLGELVYYTSAGVTGDADYRLAHFDSATAPKKAVYDIFTNLRDTAGDRVVVKDEDANFEIKASNLLAPLADRNIDGSIIDGNYNVHDRKIAGDENKVNYHNYYFDKSVKFIYVSYDKGEDEIDSIEFKNGAQNVSHADLMEAIMNWNAQACVKDDQIKAVVIKRESSDASLDRMLYVTKYLGMKEYDTETGEKGFEIEALMYKDGKWNEGQNIIVDKDLEIGAFATYSPRESTKYAENFYHVKNFTRHNANPSALYASKVELVDVKDTLGLTSTRWSKALLRLAAGTVNTIDATGKATGTVMIPLNSGAAKFNDPADNESYVMGNYRGVATTIDPGTKPEGIVNANKAYFLNMVDATKTYVKDGVERKWRDLDIDNVEDLTEFVIEEGYNASVTVLLNEKADSDGFRTAYLVVINDIYGKGNGASGDQTSNGLVSMDTAATTQKKTGSVADDTIRTRSNGGAQATFTVLAPDWAYVRGTGTASDDLVDVQLDYEVYVNGTFYDAYTETLATPTVNADKTGYTWRNLNILPAGSLDSGDKITKVVLTNVEWKNAAVDYKLNGDPATVGDPTTQPTNGTLTKFVPVNSAVNISFGVKGITAGTTGAVTSSGLKTALTEASTNITDYKSTGTFQANGDARVTINMTVASVTKEFKPTVDGDASLAATAIKDLGVTGLASDSADLNTTLAITAAPATVNEGGNVKYTLTAVRPTPSDNRVIDYTVYFKINGSDTEYSRVLDGHGGWTADYTVANVQSDVDLVVTRIVARVVTFVVTDAQVTNSGHSLLVTFADDIDTHIETGASNLSVKKGVAAYAALSGNESATESAGKLLIDMDSYTFVDGDKVDVDAACFLKGTYVNGSTASEVRNKQCIITVNKAADGTYTCTWDSTV